MNGWREEIRKRIGREREGRDRKEIGGGGRKEMRKRIGRREEGDRKKYRKERGRG